jgi:hypothetical protein
MTIQNTVELENIEHLRRQQGINDIELRQEIRQLRVGDHVRITFLAIANPAHGETVVARITSIRANQFRGRLTAGPSTLGPCRFQTGSLVVFTRNHIHSVAKGPARPPRRT